MASRTCTVTVMVFAFGSTEVSCAYQVCERAAWASGVGPYAPSVIAPAATIAAIPRTPIYPPCGKSNRQILRQVDRGRNDLVNSRPPRRATLTGFRELPGECASVSCDGALARVSVADDTRTRHPILRKMCPARSKADGQPAGSCCG